MVLVVSGKGLPMGPRDMGPRSEGWILVLGVFYNGIIIRLSGTKRRQPYPSSGTTRSGAV